MRLRKTQNFKLSPQVDPPKKETLKLKLISLRFLEPTFLVFLIGFNLLFLWPFWGKTYPQISFSTPLVPSLAKVLDLLTPFSFWQSVGFLVITSFPLLSLTTYFWFKKIFSSPTLGIVASLIFLLPFSLTARFALFWESGDGIHSFSLALIPLVALPFWEFLKRGTVNFFLLSFAGISLLALASPFGFLNSFFFLTFLTISEMLLGQARVKLFKFFLTFIFGLGGVAFWYHPGFLISLLQSPQGETVLSTLGKLIPPAFFIVPVLGAFSFLIFDRKSQLQPLFLSFSLTLFYFLLLAADNFGISYPSPDRFLPEFLLSLSLFLVTLGWVARQILNQKLLWEKIHPKLRFLHYGGKVLTVAFVMALLLWPVFSFFGGEPLLVAGDNPVLGAQNPWWEGAKGGASRLLGYGISGITLLVTGLLKWKIKT